MPVRERDCPICGTRAADGAVVPLAPDPWVLRKCPQCALVYLENAPDYSALFSTISWEKTFVAENRRRMESRPAMKMAASGIRKVGRSLYRSKLRDFLPASLEGGNLLDVGCSHGGYLLQLAESFVPFGVEISSALAASSDAAVKPFGGRVINAPAVEGIAAFPKEFFSVAILRSYLEHEIQPKEVLDSLRGVMKKESVVIVKVPNYASINRRVMGKSWCGFRFPDHVNYFTYGTLQRIAQASGFHCSFFKFKSLPTSDNMWARLTPA